MLEQFAKAAPTRYPDGFRINLRSIIELYARPLGPTLYLLLGAVGSLLLIGCANVSILLLARWSAAIAFMNSRCGRRWARCGGGS